MTYAFVILRPSYLCPSEGRKHGAQNKALWIWVKHFSEYLPRETSLRPESLRSDLNLCETVQIFILLSLFDSCEWLYLLDGFDDGVTATNPAISNYCPGYRRKLISYLIKKHAFCKASNHSNKLPSDRENRNGMKVCSAKGELGKIQNGGVHSSIQFSKGNVAPWNMKR